MARCAYLQVPLEPRRLASPGVGPHSALGPRSQGGPPAGEAGACALWLCPVSMESPQSLPVRRQSYQCGHVASRAPQGPCWGHWGLKCEAGGLQALPSN